MATTVYDLRYNGYTSVLLRYEHGEAALWVTDEYLAGAIDDEDSAQRYTLNDVNTSVPVGRDEDLDAAIESWKRSVDWESGILRDPAN